MLIVPMKPCIAFRALHGPSLLARPLTATCIPSARFLPSTATSVIVPRGFLISAHIPGLHVLREKPKAPVGLWTDTVSPSCSFPFPPSSSRPFSWLSSSGYLLARAADSGSPALERSQLLSSAAEATYNADLSMGSGSKTAILKMQPGAAVPGSPAVAPEAPSRRTFIIGVAGGTASGKTSVCRKIMEQLEEDNQGHLVSLSQDSFYRNLTLEEQAHIETYNFDHPDAFDFPELHQAVRHLKAGRSVEIPNYDYVTSARLHETTPIRDARVVLLEGILIFHLPEIRDLFDMKIFVDTDADTRLARRIRRDIVERGRDVMQVITRYEQTVKPSFETYISPTKQYADIIVPRGADNTVAINLIVQHIRSLLKQANGESQK